MSATIRNCIAAWGGVVIAMLHSSNTVALDLSPYVGLGVTFGGDKLSETQVTSKLDTKQSKTLQIRAGQFLYFFTGVSMPAPGLDQWEAHTSVGYHVDHVGANGGELRFDRIPLEFLLSKNYDNTWRVLGGFTYHLNPERRCTLDSCNKPDSKFDNALGIVAEIDWLPGGTITQVHDEDQPRPNKLWLGARVTLINYQTARAEGGTYNGTSFGLMAGLNF